MSFLYYTTLILICDVLSFFKLYYIKFKKVKILWWLDMRVGGQIAQRPVPSKNFPAQSQQ